MSTNDDDDDDDDVGTLDQAILVLVREANGNRIADVAPALLTNPMTKLLSRLSTMLKMNTGKVLTIR